MTPKSTLLLLSFLIGLFGGMWAQEPGLVWPNTYRLQMDNPVLSGFDGQNHLYLGTYQKWLGTPDAPSTSFVGASIPVVGRLLGMGGFLVRDQIGLLTQTRASVFASAHSSAAGKHRLSVGTGISWQGIGVVAPNVIDPLMLGSYRGSRLNLGLGANYRVQLGSPGSWFNLQVQVPQLFRSIELTASNSSRDFLYEYGGQFILQANLRYQLSSGNALAPSLLVQSQGLKDGQGSYLVDVGMGFSVRNDALQFRLGVRNAPASLLYAGLGVQLGKRINVAAIWEPVGPLGMSMGADMDLTFGDSAYSPAAATWYPKSFWEQRLNERGLTGYFEVNTVDTKKSIFVNYRFDDYDDLRYKLVEDEQLR
ncbi:MAG: type IX secretion system membrane protein PorP/SprF, partial [Bacteroidota bacterium]